LILRNIKFALFPIGCLLANSTAFAEIADQARFRVLGDTLYYNSSIPDKTTSSTNIDDVDAEMIGAMVMDAPDVTKVWISSIGGSLLPALAVARTIEKFKLDTEVTDVCVSACTLIFVAGRHRVLGRGALLSFHRPLQVADGFFNMTKAVRARKGPIDDFEFIAEAYDDGIESGLEIMDLMVRNGIDPEFALKVIATPYDRVWDPTRAELIAGGVLQDGTMGAAK
jgi:hypothetical protein